MQDLVNSFDDIPALMRRIREGKTSSTRFNEPNQSYQVNHVLRGYESVDINDADNKAQASRMATQAKRVLDHLSKLPGQKPHRMVQTVADVAANRLQHLQRNGVDLNRYYMQYDIHRTGRISHKDFADTLISVSSGVSRNELTSLTTALDPHKTGFVDYKQLLPKLDALRNEAPPPPQVSMASALELTMKKMVVNPRDVVDLQVLPQTRKECIHDPLNPNLSHSTSENKSKVNKQRSVAGRRLFHDRTTDILYRREAPYFTEDITTIKSERKASRSHSAPPLGRQEPQSLRQVVLLNGQESETTAPSAASSLRTHALKSYSQPTQPPTAAALVSPTRVLTQITSTRSNKTAAENTLLTQIGGNLDSLGRLFKRQDKSHSGHVNYNEFRTALMKCGAHLDDAAVKTMFEKRCLDGHEKVVDIQSFVTEMKGRASAPLFAHLQTENNTTETKDQCRAYRKALHAINKHGDPLSLARASSSSTSHSGLANPSLNEHELRQAWLISHANLTSMELNSIMNTIKPAMLAEGGSLRLEQVDTILRQSLATHTHSLEEKRQHYIHFSGRRYGASFRSQIHLGGSGENVIHSEFHALTDSKHVKEKQIHWGKVQETIQSQPEAILRAFSGVEDKIVPVVEVGKRLSQAGIMLGREDIAQLQSHFGNNNSVSMEQFCEKLNVPLQTDRLTNQQLPLDRRSMETEHGIFTSSLNTVCAEPNYASSALIETDASQRMYHFGARRKPRPNADDQVGEAFWKMEKSVENPFAFPTVWPERNYHQQQRGFYRPSPGRLSTASLHRLEADPKQAARGHISLRAAMSDTASSVAGRSISTKSSLRYYAGGGGGSIGGNRSVTSAATSSTVVPGHVIGGGRRSGGRAFSAPPRSTFQLVTGVDESTAAMENMATASASTVGAAAQQAPSVNPSVPAAARGIMSQVEQISHAATFDAGLQHVSRWSNNALAEYYKAREQLYGTNGRPNSGDDQGERVGRSTSRSQPQSRASSPGGSSVTSISSRRSLRRQFTQSVGAPFATDND